MQTLEERALVTDIQDKLIELYVDRQEAREAKDLGRMRTLQTEIDELTEQKHEIRDTGALIVRRRGARPAPRPAPGDLVLLADPGLVPGLRRGRL